ncbi:DNA-3-methyladenine glycosylase family protein [Actinomycetospora straminea]|uniref:DNA-3-methyladenine glycosylase II n=1 Tax=Actinomycetospora straminea TaxID=663607 RepID=A0ABP9EAI1_9PSEU|nr:AlkA N-terminal domain-containing protein [Actinomycetospora straminea]MDD7932067.1 AlkA N-terminal domain-containing protein [Actinomycetospora straminea]
MHVEERALSFTPPLCPDNLFGHLVATAVPGVEEWHDGAYRRTLALPGGPGVVALRPGADAVAATLTVTDPADADAAARLARRVLDLDADPVAVDATLRTDPVLRPLVDEAPGRRVPGAPDPDEFAVRAVLGQQVSTAAARTHAGRLVRGHGTPLPDGLAGPGSTLTHLFPSAPALTAVDPDELGMPRTRKRTLLTLVRALADGEVVLDPGDVPGSRTALAALPGIGPWTVDSVAMRALGDPDAFLPTDLGVRAAAERLGLPARDRDLVARAETWRPYRAYATQHLWAALDHAVNTMPG